jgi:hypothetical protein
MIGAWVTCSPFFEAFKNRVSKFQKNREKNIIIENNAINKPEKVSN